MNHFEFGRCQQSIEEAFKKPCDQTKFEDRLLEWIIHDQQSFAVVENQSFRKLMTSICHSIK